VPVQTIIAKVAFALEFVLAQVLCGFVLVLVLMLMLIFVLTPVLLFIDTGHALQRATG